ncbi:extracellular matrix protein 2 [Nematolebias whitei]|uniref:extracellular matrix protein 2 n=1 Tax=Nematolebias whitei TaxID=451745 RepID=UPI0018978BC4|nr:extracellular matrix protein 2 [Nematolebias whitei]
MEISSFGESPQSQNLTFLKKLNLDDNQMSRVPALPPSLEELRMNNNKLRALTHHFFKGLRNLLRLELKKNSLREASVSLLAFRPLQKLLDLQLDNNHFRSLPLGLPSSLQVGWRVRVLEDCLLQSKEQW